MENEMNSKGTSLNVNGKVTPLPDGNVTLNGTLTSEDARFDRKTGRSGLDVEQILEEMGGRWGGWTRWHVIMFNVLCVLGVTFIGILEPSIVFLGLEPKEMRCALPPGVSPNSSAPCEEGGVVGDAVCEVSRCEVYTNYTSDSNTTEECPDGWVYSGEINSIATEWDLVCSRSSMIETINFLSIFGMLLLATPATMSADYFGRKKVFLVTLVGSVALGVLNGVTRNLAVYILTRVLLASSLGVSINSSYVLMCELFAQASRQTAVVVSEAHFVLGMLLLSLLAFALPNWRHLMFVASLPFLLGVLAFGFIPESPSWLVSRGREEEARRVLRRIARFNGEEPPEALQEDQGKEPPDAQRRDGSSQDLKELPSVCGSLETSSKGPGKELSRGDSAEPIKGAARRTESREKTQGLRDLFRSRKLCFFLFVTVYLNFTLFLVYFGLVFNTASLPGDVYVNFALGAAAELPSIFVGVYSLRRFGRRSVAAVHFLISAVALFALLGISLSDLKTGRDELEIFCFLVGKYGNVVAFMVVILYLTEIFPTPMRSSAVTVAITGGRIGKLLSPYTSLVADLVPWLPQTLFAAMSFVAAGLMFLLPETVGRPLPQTVEDVESWSRERRAQVRVTAAPEMRPDPGTSHE